jgi:hypothetical protein
VVRIDDVKLDITIDIDLQRVEEDPIVQITPRSNNAEMDDVAHEAVTQRRKMWPKRTIKGYRKGLACWAAFCARRQFADADLVREKKILLFLKEDVLTVTSANSRLGKLY